MGRRSGVDGRELVLAAALKLFSEEGIDGVSLRAVNREAGLGPASVHYHFGTKEALLDAVIDVHGRQVIESTTCRAREILDGHEPTTARDVVAMLADPLLALMADHPEEGTAWVRVISGVLQSQPARILDRASARLTLSAAASVYPDAPPETVERAMRMCFNLLVTQVPHTRPRGRSAALDFDLLIDFLAGGLEGALRGADPQKIRRPRAS